MKEVIIDGKTYVEKDSLKIAEPVDGMNFVCVRTYSAGVFCGYLKRREGKEVELVNAIRIWYWDGAASLSQFAMEGVKKPDNCKFAMPVTKVILTEAIEILEVTEIAKNQIEGMGKWKQ